MDSGREHDDRDLREERDERDARDIRDERDAGAASVHTGGESAERRDELAPLPHRERFQGESAAVPEDLKDVWNERPDADRREANPGDEADPFGDLDQADHERARDYPGTAGM